MQRLLALLGLSLVVNVAMAESPTLADRAPAFSLPGLNGEVSLAKHRGSVVYLDFWASWCAPCRKSFPWMNLMQARYGKQGLVVIAVNLDESREAAKQFLLKREAGFTVAFDSKGKTAEQYGLTVMPTSYLIDRQGHIMQVHYGFRESEKEDMEKQIKRLLKSR